MDRGVWQATVRGVAKNQTRLNNTHTHTTKTGLGVGLHVTKIIKLRKIQTELKQSGLISCMSHPKRVMICLFQR